MNTLILNRDSFSLPEDGWYQVAPLGEFPHGPAGVMQVVDKAACDAMVNAFGRESEKANFPGLLIDFDHFSLDDKLKSEAAGWITALEFRVPNRTANPPSHEASAGGLYARIRWSDTGEECVSGGRYRFLSPVWSRKDCEDLGNGRLRPVRLLNAAVTNDPNLKGMRPLSNRGQQEDFGRDLRDGQDGEDGPSQSAPRIVEGRQDGGERIANADGGDERYRWELGETEDERHCPSCAALAGQVHTKQEWEDAGLSPGAGALYCHRNCHCSLVKTDEAVTGTLNDAPQRKPAPESDGERIGNAASEDDALANVGWTDEARAASLAVRRAKASVRSAAQEGSESESETDDATGDGAPDDTDSSEEESAVDDLTEEEYDLLRTTEAMESYRDAAESAFHHEYGYYPTTPDEIAEGEELADVPEEYQTHGEMTPAEMAEQLVTGAAEDVPQAEPEPVPTPSSETAPSEPDYASWFEDEGLATMSDEAIDGLAEQIREKLDAGEPLDAAEEGFLEELWMAGFTGESEDDPIAEWQRQVAGGGAMGNRGQADPSSSRGASARDYDAASEALENIGWTDEARAASLAVRRAKAVSRSKGSRGIDDPDEEEEQLLSKETNGLAPEEPPDEAEPRPRPEPPRIPPGGGPIVWARWPPYWEGKSGPLPYPYPYPYPNVPRPTGRPTRPPEVVGFEKAQRRKVLSGSVDS